MRIVIVILAAVLALGGLAENAAAAPKAAPDGSLVLESGKNLRKGKGSEDTLCDLLGQEVQVFIFNSKTRVFPPVYLKSKYLISSPGAYQMRYNPQVEALIHKYARLYGVDPALVRAVMRHESGFNPGAVSPKGAQGLMQLMPGTAALMGVNNPFDPEQNVAGGVGYLRRCLDRFGHNVPLAVAAYNAGPERVANFGTIPPIPETQLFVHNVMGTYAGPSQMMRQVPPKGKAAAAGQDPLKGKGLKQAAGKADQAKDGPRRPKAKIIEVRSLKPKAAANSSQ
ncbi:MAG TPA: lytic transglycosylase domain-containing protein [Desulfobaccales bacterium]